MSVISPLEQFLVVDFSTGIPGGYCTKMLADAGAEVVKLEPPEGDPLRRWSASGARIAGDDDGALFHFLGCSKRSVRIDPTSATDCEFAHGLISRADATVWSPGSRLAEHPGFSPSALRKVPRARSLRVSRRLALTVRGLKGRPPNSPCKPGQVE